MNFLKLTLFATRVLGLGLGLRLRQIASTRRRVNAKRTEVRAQKLVKQLPSQFMFVLALLGAVGQVAALPLLACEMMVTPAGALNCHLGMHTSAPLDQLSHLGHSDSSFSDTSHADFFGDERSGSHVDVHTTSLVNQAQTHSSEQGGVEKVDGHTGLSPADHDCDSCLSCSVVSSINPQPLNRPDSPALLRESYLAPTLSNSLENLF
ncbi:hypothetical protein N9D35_07135, partial [Gammaproteobacteria bacterium]|nr:hypothetical protein [Gammaproteobacteria bacterium]